MAVSRKYKTFWPRFWAIWIDSVVLSPLMVLDFYLREAISLPLLGAAWMAVNGLIGMG